jgi:hypothetical protein
MHQCLVSCSPCHDPRQRLRLQGSFRKLYTPHPQLPLSFETFYYYDNVERHICHALGGQVFEFADAKAFLTAHSLFHMENFGFGPLSPRRGSGWISLTKPLTRCERTLQYKTMSLKLYL